MIKTIKRILSCVVICAVLFPSYAATPSPAMIAQLKKLPKAEQQRLMKQYGLTTQDLSSNSDKASQAKPDEFEGKNPVTSESEPEKADLPPEQQRFGLELFRSTSTVNTEHSSIPVPDFYVLGAGDELLIQIFGKENSTEQLKIERDGTVQLPQLGPVVIAGLTFAEAKAVISDKIKKQILGVDVAVSMGSLKTIPVFIAGEAKKPGSYQVPSLSTITQALTVAGGISDIGSLRDVQLKRNGTTVVRFDLYDLLLRGDASHDMQLQAGDVVFVAPVKAVAQVIGEVQRPAIYEVLPLESVEQLLTMAGGSKAGAYTQGAVLERINSKNVRDLMNLDLTTTSARTLQVKNGDVLRIGSTSARIENAVTIAGAVVRPGHYAWKDGMRLNDLLNSLWADVHVSADLDYALIIREQNISGETTVLQFNLGQAITEPMSEQNVRLAARDLVLVFHHENLSVDRDKLNKYFREKMLDAELLLQHKYTTQSEGQTTAETVDLNYESLPDQAFRLIEMRQLLLEQNVVADTLKSEQNWLLAEMNNFYANLFTSPELLAMTPQLRRKELLLPVLRKLKTQNNPQLGLQIAYVNGEVMVPGEYPLPAQASVKKLIAAAGGLKESAYLQRAELTRAFQASSESDINIEHINVDLAKAISDEQEFSVFSRDTLNVFAIPNWNIKRQFRISGNVRFPGTYSIQQGETLSSVLRRAGGLKETAFAEGAIYTRKQTKEREEEQVRKLAQQLRADVAARSLTAEGSSVSPQDSMLMIAELEKVKPVGRMVVDLPAIMAGKAGYDLVAEDGDELIIPAMNTSVSVVGEVQHASSHRYREGLALEDYLQLAGGFRKRGDTDRVYVIRADGSVFMPEQNSWFAVTERRLQPGDTIVVPLDTEYKDTLSVWTEITQIIYQSTVALAAINSL